MTTSTGLASIPHDPNKGGSRFGWHFIALYKTCAMKWFLTYVYGHPTGTGIGCAPRTVGDALELGTFAHRGLQGWYESDPIGGQYDIEAAIDAIDKHAALTRPLLGDERTAKLVGEAVDILMKHHAYCGPGGVLPEWPTWKPVTVDGKLVCERTFEVPLGWGDYVFTSQPDVVVEGFGKLWPLDHKTCAANRTVPTLREYKLSGQVTGQLWAMREVWGDRVSEAGLINLIIKGGAASRPPRQLEMSSRTALDLEVFRNNTVRALKRMNEDVDEWRSLCNTGMDHMEAALIVFDSHPDAKRCVNDWWPCDFFDACATRSEMRGWLTTETVARTQLATPAPTKG